MAKNIRLLESFENPLLGSVEIWQRHNSDIRIFCIFDKDKNSKLYNTYSKLLKENQTVLKFKGSIKDLLKFYTALDKQDSCLNFNSTQFVDYFIEFSEYCSEINRQD